MHPRLEVMASIHQGVKAIVHNQHLDPEGAVGNPDPKCTKEEDDDDKILLISSTLHPQHPHHVSSRSAKSKLIVPPAGH
ncbi:hypothetical protein NDU88_003660 [Pleurodeles waltl]|uniref:Uncharacterized protein n=1 Tax=Pleurodeles waltl TaxID=8319 RepID=A0AAV7NIU7_PLEWA|nr:hypothetical protein NDU88_003660 [Pleurodeles waltl]